MRPLPTLDQLCAVVGARPGYYSIGVCEAFVRSRRLRCPRCGEWLTVTLEAYQDAHNFDAWCGECGWPEESAWWADDEESAAAPREGTDAR